MIGLYARWIDRWERHLAARDTNRVVREFDWGLEWLRPLGLDAPASPNGDSGHYLERFIQKSIATSEHFFAVRPITDYRLDGSHLRFTSAVPSPHPENNTVHASYFPAPGSRRAVLVLPQWNADSHGHIGLCKLLNRFGLSALRMSLAYHDRRMPPELERADYHVSSNLGRTIHACRQSVVDARACLDWLQARGYERLGILGTSLGSCVSLIAAAHDPRVRSAVFNHVSMYFSDVVWTGISTQHVRKGLAGKVTQDDLRRYWAVISPAPYLTRLEGRDLRSLLIWAPFDSCFLPDYSRQVLAHFQTHRLPHETFTLPCGHYTTGRFPFSLMDGLAMCRFLRKRL